MDERSRQISKQSVEKVQEVGSAVFEASASAASDVKDVVVESVSSVKEAMNDVKPMETIVVKSAESSMVKPAEASMEKPAETSMEKPAEGEENVWEAPSLWKCITTILGGLLGYS